MKACVRMLKILVGCNSIREKPIHLRNEVANVNSALNIEYGEELDVMEVSFQ
jgi:hypothetical protein